MLAAPCCAHGRQSRTQAKPSPSGWQESTRRGVAWLAQVAVRIRCASERFEATARSTVEAPSRAARVSCCHAASHRGPSSEARQESGRRVHGFAPRTARFSGQRKGGTRGRIPTGAPQQRERPRHSSQSHETGPYCPVDLPAIRARKWRSSGIRLPVRLAHRCSRRAVHRSRSASSLPVAVSDRRPNLLCALAYHSKRSALTDAASACTGYLRWPLMAYRNGLVRCRGTQGRLFVRHARSDASSQGPVHRTGDQRVGELVIMREPL